MTRFTSECDLCADLLTEYIAAGNEMVETQDRALSIEAPTSRQLASALIDRALRRRNQARREFLAHKEQQH